MTNIIKRFSLYWNEPLRPLSTKELAELEAMEQLLIKIRVLEKERGYIEYKLPEFYCILDKIVSYWYD